jgi:putative signal transducing protein
MGWVKDGGASLGRGAFRGRFTMSFTDPRLVEIYRAKNLPQAHMIRIALEEAGIQAQIEGELLQGAVGQLPIGWVTAPRILVDESQIAAAREIIDCVDTQESSESEEDDRDEVTRCLACGTVMVEGEPKCPSCGWSYQGEEEGQTPAE